ncbi:hypothetical protein SBA6_490001 [Candidatus Sulfopaludibacter sp. SbA6]|nr:hypothetical protein SBA6_490001 [Candidatus Sulfopaludibacter sp. SbA6]
MQPIKTTVIGLDSALGRNQDHPRPFVTQIVKMTLHFRHKISTPLRNPKKKGALNHHE